MQIGAEKTSAPVALDRAGLDALIQTLQAQGYETLGPTVRDGAVTHDAIDGVDDLPRGTTDEQAPGRYRLRPRADDALFGYAVGPESWKRALHAPRQRLWRAEGEGDALRLVAEAPDASPTALIGVRACDLAAIAILDRVLTGGAVVDPHYAARRSAFIVAVNCAESGDLCFCASMGTGPACRDGFDVALTELPRPDACVLVAEAGSARGAALLAALPSRPATAAEMAEAQAAPAEAAAAQTRAMPAGAARISGAPDHPAWRAVTERCLSCANCTLVCPTCFCCTTEDRTALDGSDAERWRRWDSCFTADFSHIHGGPVRPSGAARYRQWLTHKLSTWVDQFGSSGCVGCGRCVAWCPVGIDLVAEARALCAPAEPQATTAEEDAP